MTEAASILAGPLVTDGSAPDIAGRIKMALELVERMRTGLAKKLAAFADVPAAFRTGLEQLGHHGGLLPTALTFGLMLGAGLVPSGCSARGPGRCRHRTPTRAWHPPWSSCCSPACAISAAS